MNWVCTWALIWAIMVYGFWLRLDSWISLIIAAICGFGFLFSNAMARMKHKDNS